MNHRRGNQAEDLMTNDAADRNQLAPTPSDRAGAASPTASPITPLTKRGASLPTRPRRRPAPPYGPGTEQARVFLRPPVLVLMSDAQRAQAISILAAMLMPVLDRRDQDLRRAA